MPRLSPLFLEGTSSIPTVFEISGATLSRRCQRPNDGVPPRERKGNSVSLLYRAMYGLRWYPWEAGVTRFGRDLDQLLTPPPRIGRANYTYPTPGRALDIGCGRGHQAVVLARRGWDVTGIDIIKSPLESARERARRAHVDVDFRHADINDPTLDLGGPFDLILDVGCYHGIRHDLRRRYVKAVTRLAAPGASLLMFAYGRGYRGPLPNGTSRLGIEHRFTDWTLVADTDADSAWLPSGLRKVDPRWFLLVRD